MVQMKKKGLAKVLLLFAMMIVMVFGMAIMVNAAESKSDVKKQNKKGKYRVIFVDTLSKKVIKDKYVSATKKNPGSVSAPTIKKSGVKKVKWSSTKYKKVKPTKSIKHYGKEYANYIIKTKYTYYKYRITYNYKGQSDSKYVKFPKTIKLPNPTRTGYKLKYWRCTNNNVNYVPGATFDPNINTINIDKDKYVINMQPQWEALSKTDGEVVKKITYNLDGGSFSGGSAPSSYATTQSTITIPVPSKSGQKFAYWLVNNRTTHYGEGKTSWSFKPSTFSYADLTLKAVWKVPYSINYHGTDGAKWLGNPLRAYVTGDTATITKSNGQAYSNDYKLQKSGYFFKGWTTVSGSNEPQKNIKITKTSTGNKDLYACWGKYNYTVTYSGIKNQEENAINPKYFDPDEGWFQRINGEDVYMGTTKYHIHDQPGSKGWKLDSNSGTYTGSQIVFKKGMTKMNHTLVAQW